MNTIICGSSLLYQSAFMANTEGLVQGTFGRRGGVSSSPFNSLNTSYASGDFESSVRQNIEIVSRAISIQSKRIFTASLNHGDTVISVTEELLSSQMNTGRDRWPVADSLITNSPGIYLMMSSADCAILTLIDTRNRAIALIHAGWKGIVSRIITKTVDYMSTAFNTRPNNLIGILSPSIGPCCYRIKDPQQQNMPNWKRFLHRGLDGLTAIDLRSAVVVELVDAGIRIDGIDNSAPCTACNTGDFFSFFLEKPRTGRMPTVVGLRR